MSKSIKTNFIFNLINTVIGLLFPLIVFPYASRILLADGIGQVQFYQSIINYIVLLTGLGIPLYGIKEIARVRDNIEDLSRTTIELILLGLILSIIGYLIVAVLCCVVGQIQDNIPLFLILSSTILLTNIGCPWFYNGIEDFKYITIRGIIVRLICLFFLFVFVKTRDDLLLYGVYTVVGSLGNNVINFIRLRKYISFSTIFHNRINFWRHLKPAAAVFLLNIVTSIYVNLDSVMLGFLSNTTAVGYYTGATKISHVLVTVVISLGTVLLPRSSYLIKKGCMDDFFTLSVKSYNFITMLSFPILSGVLILSPSIILLLCGNSFTPSIITLRIIAPIIVFIGISNLLGIQILYPLGKVKLVTICTAIGACVNLLLNFLLIPFWQENGAAVATAMAELSVTMTLLLIVRKIAHIPFVSKKTGQYFLFSFILAPICYFVQKHINGELLIILISTILGTIIYISLLIVVKDELIVNIFSQIKVKLLGTSKNEKI